MKTNTIYRIFQKLASGELTPEQRTKLIRWFVSPLDTGEKEDALQRVWEESGNELQDVSGSLRQVHDKIGMKQSRHPNILFFQRALRYAAMLMLPLLTGLSVWFYSQKQYADYGIEELYVAYGDRQTFILPDGSTVNMNAGTILHYPKAFTGDKRMVYLSGEANFSVVKNEKKPFIVQSGNVKVEVTGTQFNVEAYAGSGLITTTLESGSVEVSKVDHPGAVIPLLPQEQLTYYVDSDSFVKSTVEVSDYTAWISGELRFLNKSLDEILITLERRYNVRIYVDPLIRMNDSLTMRFRAHETIDDALHVFCSVLGNIHYQRDGQIVRLSAGKEVKR